MASRSPTPWSFALAFRRHWFAAMSGGASVPFTALAVFAESRWAEIIFVCCAVFCAWFAAYRVWKSERKKVIKLEEEQTAAVASRNSTPDVAIESTSRAQIFEEQPDEATGKGGGIFIVFSRIKVINRDDRRASLEFHLRVNLGPRAFIRCAQIPEWLADSSKLFVTGAHRLPSILNIEPRTTEDGYFAFFWPYPLSDTTEMVLRVGGNKKETSLLEVVERYDFDMLVNEHTSETHHEIPAAKHIHYSLRPNKKEEATVPG